MKQIEFECWEPDAENPCKLKYAGQRTAEDVFHELEARLDSVGYLPDEYLLLDRRWQNGCEMPRDAGFFLSDRLWRQRRNLSGCVSGMVRGQSAQDRAFHDRQNAWRKRRGSGSDVPHFLCDHESDSRRQQCPRAVHGGWRAARTGRNDVPEPVSGRAAHPAGSAGRGRRKNSCGA